MWAAFPVVVLLVTTQALPVDNVDSPVSLTEGTLVQPALVQASASTDGNVEVSSINDRIFDDAWEKSNFEQRKHEMNQIVASSTTQAERVQQCKGNCGEGLNLFTVWTTVAEGWNNKYTHSIDSALYHHPKAKVSIFSSSLPDDFLDDFKKLGYNVEIQKINLAQRAVGTPMATWADKLDSWHDGPFYYAHLSDATRLLVLYREGGVYFDTDVVFVNPVDNVRNAVGWERPDSLCNAMMAFDKDNKYLEEVLTRFSNDYVKDDWAANGPFLLTKVYNDKFKASDQVHAIDQSAFYLIQWEEVVHFFDSAKPADVDRDLQILKQKALVVHFWNSRSHDLVVHPDSLMGKMFNTFCVSCNPISHPVLAIKPSAEETKASQLVGVDAVLKTETVAEQPIAVFVYDDLEAPFDDMKHMRALTLDNVFGEALPQEGIQELQGVPIRFTYESMLTEILLYRLKNSASKYQVTTDPAKADLFLITAGAKHRNFDEAWDFCGQTRDSPNRLEQMLPHLNAETASKHFMVFSQVIRDVDKCEGWWSQPEGLLSKAVRVALEDPEYAARDWWFNERGLKNFFSAPYPSMIHWSTAFDKDASLQKPWALKSNRHVLMAFMGNLERQLWPSAATIEEGDPTLLRHYLQESCHLWGDSICMVRAPSYKLSPTIQQFHNTIDESQKVTNPVTVAHGIRQIKQESVFCLEPPGETASRKSLVESLLFGCIPVIFTRSQEALYERYWGAWHQDSRVYVSAQDLISGTKDLRQELQSIPKARVAEMQATIAKNAHRMQYALDDVDGDGVDVLMQSVLAISRQQKA